MIILTTTKRLRGENKITTRKRSKPNLRSFEYLIDRFVYYSIVSMNRYRSFFDTIEYVGDDDYIYSTLKNVYALDDYDKRRFTVNYTNNYIYDSLSDANKEYKFVYPKAGLNKDSCDSLYGKCGVTITDIERIYNDFLNKNIIDPIDDSDPEWKNNRVLCINNKNVVVSRTANYLNDMCNRIVTKMGFKNIIVIREPEEFKKYVYDKYSNSNIRDTEMKYPKLGIRYYYNYHDLKDCWNK